MPKGTPLSDRKVESIAHWARKGWDPARVSRKVKVPYATVYRVIARLGIEVPDGRRA